MGQYPEDQLEFQYLYGRQPWFCCEGCLYTEPGKQRQPDVAFEVVVKPERRDETLTLEFDPYEESDE